MEKDNSLVKIKFSESIIISFITLFILGGIMIFIEDVTPHFAIIVAMIFLIIYGLVKGTNYVDMQNSMVKSVNLSMGAIYLFFFIGILTTVLITSGAIPTVMYYGLNVMSERTFYVSTFIIISIIGISIGSSLTTIATIGVALMGISNTFHLNSAITAGAIVSGAFFGDKMSPLSDTTNIAASVVGIDLFDHIKSMSKTTIPVFFISSIVYFILSINVNVGSVNDVEIFRNDILSTGLVHWFSIIPFIVLIVLAFLKIHSVISLIITIFVNVIITFMHSNITISNFANYIFYGFKSDTLSGNVEILLSRGGISSMFFSITIVILALSLGGLLISLGIVDCILNRFTNYINSTSKAITVTALTSVGINFLVGEQYLSIMLTGNTFKGVYTKLGLQPRLLSRTLEDAGTVINPLVPWSVCGTFIFNNINVSVLDYLPFAFFCYGSLIFTIFSGFITQWLQNRKKQCKDA